MCEKVDEKWLNGKGVILLSFTAILLPKLLNKPNVLTADCCLRHSGPLTKTAVCRRKIWFIKQLWLVNHSELDYIAYSQQLSLA